MTKDRLYSIIVKGCGTAAISAALEHNCEPLQMGVYKSGSTTVYVAGRLVELAAWLSEPPRQAPFPVGTLLCYRELEQDG
jgi:hypothetical protein